MQPKTHKFHNFQEGDTGKPIDRKGKHLRFFAKGYWKRIDRKKFYRALFKQLDKE